MGPRFILDADGDMARRPGERMLTAAEEEKLGAIVGRDAAKGVVMDIHGGVKVSFDLMQVTVNREARDMGTTLTQNTPGEPFVTMEASGRKVCDIRPQHPTTGGISVKGIQQSSGPGIVLLGAQGTPDTAKGPAANAAVVLNGGVQAGTAMGALSPDGNIAAIRNNGKNVFLFDAEGCLWGGPNADVNYLDAMERLEARIAALEARG